MAHVFASFIIAVFIAAFSSEAVAQQPVDDEESQIRLTATCLDACATHMQSCNADAAIVETNCALLNECKDVSLDEKLAAAIVKVCEATCDARENCTGTGGVLPPIKGSAHNPPPAAPKPPVPQPNPAPPVTAKQRAEYECKAKGGVLVEVADATGTYSECMTIGRLYARLVVLERKVEAMKSGDPDAIAALQKEVDALKSAASVSPDFAKANESRFKALEDMLEIEHESDEIRSRRLDQHAQVLKSHTASIADLELNKGNDVVGVDVGGVAWAGTQKPYDRFRGGVGVMARLRGRVDPLWDLGVAGELCYSGEDPSGASLKCVAGEASVRYRAYDDWFSIRFGVDTLWRLNPNNEAESSSSGPLFGISFTPGDDENRANIELNGGVKATVVPEAVAAGTALHAIPDAVLNLVVGYGYN